MAIRRRANRIASPLIPVLPIGHSRRPEARLTSPAAFWSARIADFEACVYHYR